MYFFKHNTIKYDQVNMTKTIHCLRIFQEMPQLKHHFPKLVDDSNLAHDPILMNSSHST